MTPLAVPTLDFVLTPEVEAATPPEERGRGRDDVRLLVSRRGDGALEHHRFADLPDLLRQGDIVVVNNSATIPAALRGSVAGAPALLHLSNRLDGGDWVAELRHAGGPGAAHHPWLDATPGTVVHLAGGGAATLEAPAGPATPGGVRLWRTRLDLPLPLAGYLAAHARPIRYNHLARDYPLDAYQTVFATIPGSVEMPSAARPFTDALVTRLVVRGVALAPLWLHCGVSSPEAHEPPTRERFHVPAETAARVNAARRLGGRVVAVGTTVVRALESASTDSGLVMPADGWTELVVDARRTPRSVDALLTGWHEPRASHLAMLEAMAGRDLLERSYLAALEAGYLWHEFGDSHLVLP